MQILKVGLVGPMEVMGEGSLTPEVQNFPKAPLKDRHNPSEAEGRGTDVQGLCSCAFTSVCWSVNILLSMPEIVGQLCPEFGLRVHVRNLCANYLTGLEARIGAGRFLSGVCYRCTW